MNKSIFNKYFSLLVKAFPDKQLHADLMLTFLNDLTDEQFAKAVSEIINGCSDINKATNIVALIREKACLIDKTEAGEAWGEVVRLVSKVGSYGVPKFSSKSIKKTVESIGWRNICLSENPSIERAHFLKIFESIRDRSNEQLKASPQLQELTSQVIKQLEQKDGKINGK